MRYNLIFDRRSLALLVSGLALGGGMLFCAGLLVGVNWTLPYQARPAALQAAAPPVPCGPAEPPPDQLPAAAPAVLAAAPAEEPAPPEPELEPPAMAAAEPLPEEPPAPPVAAAAPAVSGGSGGRAFAVQLGAFAQPRNSAALVRDLEARGFEPYVVELPRAAGGALLAVRIGRWADRSEAVRIAAELRREGVDAIVERTAALPADGAGAGAAL